MEYLTLASGLVAFVALFFAGRVARRANYLQEWLDAMNNRYFTVVSRLRELEGTSQRELMDLKVELKRQAGLLKFEPQMTIGEITERHPRGRGVGRLSPGWLFILRRQSRADAVGGGTAVQHTGCLAHCAGLPMVRVAAAASLSNGEVRTVSDNRLTTDPDLRIIAKPAPTHNTTGWRILMVGSRFANG
jgi:hypothetical protein